MTLVHSNSPIQRDTINIQSHITRRRFEPTTINGVKEETIKFIMFDAHVRCIDQSTPNHSIRIKVEIIEVLFISALPNEPYNCSKDVHESNFFLKAEIWLRCPPHSPAAIEQDSSPKKCFSCYCAEYPSKQCEIGDSLRVSG